MGKNIKMSIHRALSELKILDDRIEKSIREATFVTSAGKMDTKVNDYTLEDYKSKVIQASYDKVNSLMERRKRIKAAITLSNALTDVTVGEETMKVAAAIDLKNSISLKKSLHKRMLDQYNQHVYKINEHNRLAESRLDTYLTGILGSKENASEQDLTFHTKAFQDRNEQVLINPLDLVQKVNELGEYILTFEAEVDAVLSESNATTFIEFEE